MAVPSWTAAGRDATASDGAPSAPATRAAAPEPNTRGIRERDLRGHLEAPRIDHSQHGIRGGGLDEVAGIVRALGDDAVEGRVDAAAGGDGFSGRAAARAPARSACASATSCAASSTSFRAATPRSNRSRMRVSAACAAVKPRLGARDLRPLLRHLRDARRDLEAHEQVSAAHGLAFALRNLGHTCRLGRDDDQLGARRRRDQPAGVDECRNPADFGHRRRHRNDGFAFDVFGRRLRTGGECKQSEGKRAACPEPVEGRVSGVMVLLAQARRLTDSAAVRRSPVRGRRAHSAGPPTPAARAGAHRASIAAPGDRP